MPLKLPRGVADDGGGTVNNDAKAKSNRLQAAVVQSFVQSTVCTLTSDMIEMLSHNLFNRVKCQAHNGRVSISCFHQHHPAQPAGGPGDPGGLDGVGDQEQHDCQGYEGSLHWQSLHQPDQPNVEVRVRMSFDFCLRGCYGRMTLHSHC